MHRFLPLAIALSLTGCASISQVYLHDAQRAADASAAKDAFAMATSEGLWPTMLANLESSSKVEREVLNRTFELRFEGDLQTLPYLTWKDIAECADGNCDGDLVFNEQKLLSSDFLSLSTPEKIAATAIQVRDIGIEIATIQDLMDSDPTGARETGSLSAAPGSSISTAVVQLNEAVARIETKLSAAKTESLEKLTQNIQNIVAPITNQFAGQETQLLSNLNSRIGSINTELNNVESYLDLPGEAAKRIIDALQLPAEISTKARSELNIKLNELFAPLKHYLGSTELALKDADDTIASALGDSTLQSKSLSHVADLLRKANHLDLLRTDTLQALFGDDALQKMDDISVARQFDKLKAKGLPLQFQASLNEQGVSNVENYGQLLTYLKTDDSKLQEVRVSLLTDWRAAVVEERARRLESLREKLTYTKRLASALEQQRNSEVAVGSLLKTLRAKYDLQDDETVFATLHCAARSAGTVTGNKCITDASEARQLFENGVAFLAKYFRRIGYLHDNELLARYELALHAHRRSIVESQGAAVAYERMIEHGLQGLAAFTQGGITTEQSAAVLRFISSGLLLKIATD